VEPVVRPLTNHAVVQYLGNTDVAAQVWDVLAHLARGSGNLSQRVSAHWAM
jgi:hypothetical protein